MLSKLCFRPSISKISLTHKEGDGGPSERPHVELLTWAMTRRMEDEEEP